jgi:hypothetical protein
MRIEATPHHFPVNGNKSIEYEGKVIFPVNAVLARTLQKDEKAKVIFLSITGSTQNAGAENIARFRDELDSINKKIGAVLFYETIEAPFDPRKAVFEQLIGDIVSRLEPKSRIIADITFGSKPIFMSVFCALTFAEKNFDARIQHIVYGKADFIEGKPCNQELYDIAHLYYLNKLIGSMECKNAESAVRLLNEFFAL